MTRDNITPMMKQYFEIKNKYKDYILFYRLGDFYEMFYEDAIIGSDVLDIVLSARNAGGGEKAPLCGVPFHSASTYISKMVNAGYQVAICEQVEDPATAKGIVKREVVKLITKGTMIDQDALDGKENNFLASLQQITNTDYALTICDLSTFDIKALSLSNIVTDDELVKELSNRNISEIIVCENKTFEIEGIQITELSRKYFSNRTDLIDKFIGRIIDERFIPTINALFEYILKTQMINFNIKFSFETIEENEYLKLDSTAIKNLEIFRTISGNKGKGSLINILDNTITSQGSRMLKQWLTRPLKDREKINSRLNCVEKLYDNTIVTKSIRKNLRNVRDIERILSKLILGSIMPKDILAIMKTIDASAQIDIILLTLNLPIIKFEDLSSISARITSTIVEEPPNVLKDGGYIKTDIREDLKEYSYILENGKKLLLELETNEKKKTNINNLKIKYNRVFGYFFEVTNAHKNKVPDYFIRKQTLTGSERYFTTELKELEEKIYQAKEKTIQIEKEIYSSLVEYLKSNSEKLLKLSKTLSVLDVLANFADTALKRKYIRPEFNNENRLLIQNARHPVVEDIIGEENYIANTLEMSLDDRFHLITGPNMAGKSTYLRQNALIIIMASIGSFVPCNYCSIPEIDAVFTRIGASDDISKGNSTFMVEMNELAYILHNATDKSFILLDEVGRGTSTSDGLSIAWAVCEYLTVTLIPYVLFATHFHELTDLEIDKIKNYCTEVDNTNGELVFSHSIKKGAADKSYGIEAAKLAGIPDSIIKRSMEISEMNIGPNISKEPIIIKEPIEKEVDINSLDLDDALELVKDIISMRKNDGKN